MKKTTIFTLLMFFAVFTANAQTVVIDSVNTQLGFNASMDTIPVKINIIGCPDLNKKVWVEFYFTGDAFLGLGDELMMLNGGVVIGDYRLSQKINLSHKSILHL